MNYRNGKYCKGRYESYRAKAIYGRIFTKYNELQHHRHDVRPGLTGYAQAHGRNTVHGKISSQWMYGIRSILVLRKILKLSLQL